MLKVYLAQTPEMEYLLCGTSPYSGTRLYFSAYLFHLRL